MNNRTERCARSTRRRGQGAAAMRVAGLLATLLLAISLFPGRAEAQFGKNQVQWDHFDWKVLESPHFAFYYYEGTEEAVRDAALIAERSYAYVSQALQVDFKDPIPVLLYADHKDFQQTNAVSAPREGTQGVTESLKQRVILPMMPSMAEFTHVFTHELVHAFQYKLLGAGESLSPLQWSPPLWMMEGMSEYISQGMNPTAEMWLKDMVVRDEIMTLRQLENTRDQRVYQVGNGFYYFLAQRYGHESVRRFFKQTILRRDWMGALAEVYKMSPKEVSEEWEVWLKERYADEIASQEEVSTVGEALIRHEGQIYNLNLTPSISPGGDRIAFVANRNLRDGVYIANAETGEIRQAIAKGGASGSLEMIDFFESTMSWTADGSTLAFVASAGPNDVIHLRDAESGKSVKRLRWKEMSVISAAISPDGSKVAFTGMRGGSRDLYVADAATGDLRRLTDDVYTYLHPAWSHDGKTLAVATDAGQPTRVMDLDFRGYRLALIDAETGSRRLLTGGSYHDLNPVWSPDGERIAFLSDRAGVRQVFVYDMDSGIIRQVTNLVTGVSGITTTSPAISWAGETGTMAFSSFRDQGWDIYTMPDPTEKAYATLAADEGMAEPHTPIWAGYRLGSEDTFAYRDYSPRITADYVFGGGGFATNVGILGDVVVGFSDMTGNHSLTLYLGLLGSLDRSNITGMYVNRSRRLQWGLSLYQQRYDIGLGYSFSGTQYYSRLYRGISLDGYYPFSRFSRVEGSVGWAHISESIQAQSFFGSFQGERELQDYGSYSYGSVSTAHVYDSALYYISGPVGGQRWRASVDQAFGEFSGTTLMLDYRKYFNVNERGALAFRAFGGTFRDESDQVGRAFRVGGPTTVHGTDYGQMYGTNAAWANLEMRYPMLPWASINWDFLNVAAFADAGAVWEEGSEARWLEPDQASNALIRNGIVGAAGAGVRANLGYFTLFLDYAWPTDFQGAWGQGRLQFAIGQVF
ncbi:MAG: LpqB family beta-propeller domain-containing protein [bacterium]